MQPVTSAGIIHVTTLIDGKRWKTCHRNYPREKLAMATSINVPGAEAIKKTRIGFGGYCLKSKHITFDWLKNRLNEVKVERVLSFCAFWG